MNDRQFESQTAIDNGGVSTEVPKSRDQCFASKKHPVLEAAEIRRRLAVETKPLIRRMLEMRLNNVEQELSLGRVVESKQASIEPSNKLLNPPSILTNSLSPRNTAKYRPPTLGDLVGVKRAEGAILPDLKIHDPTASEVDSPQDWPEIAEVQATAAIGSSIERLATSIGSDSTRVQEMAYQHLQSSISKADHKTMFFLGALLATLAFFLNHRLQVHWLKDPGNWTFLDFMGFAGMAGLAAASGIMPAALFIGARDSNRGMRLLDAMTEPNQTVGGSVEVTNKPNLSARSALQNDLYELAIECDAKYRALKIGLWVGTVAALISLAAFLFSGAKATYSGPRF